MANSVIIVQHYPSVAASEFLKIIVIDNGDGTAALYVAASNGTYPSSPTAIVPAGLTLQATSVTVAAVLAALGYTPENAARKGMANGYAGLDAGGLVPTAQLPALVYSFNTRTGAITLVSGDVTAALGFTPENIANKNIASGYAGLNSVDQFISGNILGGLALGPLLVNPVYQPVRAFGLAAASTDLYTVPAGKKAFIAGITIRNNALITVSFQIRRKRGAANNVLAFTSATTINIVEPNIPNMVLLAGDIIAIVPSALGGNIQMRILEMDDTTPVVSKEFSAFAVGDNTIYTVPADKAFLPMNGTFSSSVLLNSTQGVNISNSTGAPLATVVINVVPDGDAPSTGNLVTPIFSVADQVSVQRNISGAFLDAGASLSINTGSAAAGQFAWISGIEYDV